MNVSEIENIIVFTNNEKKENSQRVLYARRLANYFEASLQIYPKDSSTFSNSASQVVDSLNKYRQFSAFSSLGRNFDLIVLGKKVIGNSYFPDIFHSASQFARNADCPALVIPPNISPEECTLPIKHPLVLWNYQDNDIGSLKHALPFLRGKSASIILCESNSYPVSRTRVSTLKHDLSDFFQANDVNCRLIECPEGEFYADDKNINSLIAREKFDLVVMRAYGYSRLSDLLQGVLPRNILNSSDRPVLLTT